MVGFLMVNGLSRVDFHWGHPYKQLPALKQSLAQVVHLLSLGATRYQAFSLNKAKTVLGVLCFSFFSLFPQITYAQSSQPLPVKQVINQVKNQINPSESPAITSPTPVPTPVPPPPATNFQLPHPGYITTTFSAYHPGIDLCIGLGMPIKPIAKGVVSEAGYNFWGLGLMVEVDHGNGFKSLYAHMGKIYVNKGKEVNTDDLLGEVGMTGHTSGPHTHLELTYNNQKIDPRPLLPEIRSYPKEEDFIVHQSSTPSAVLVPTPVQPSASQSAYIPVFTPEPEEKKPEIEPITLEKISESTLTTLLEVTEATSSPMPVLSLIPDKKFPTPKNPNVTLEEVLTLSKPTLYVTPETIQVLNSSKIAEQTLEKMLAHSTIAPSPQPVPVGGRINLISLNNLLK